LQTTGDTSESSPCTDPHTVSNWSLFCRLLISCLRCSQPSD